MATDAKQRAYLIVIGILTLLLIAALGWKWAAGRQTERLLAEQRAQFVQEKETQRQLLLSQAQQALFALSTEMLRLAGLPLAWAVRNGLAENNLRQVNAYFLELAKNPGVQEILVTDPSGIVLVSTNKVTEGQPLDPRRYSRTVLDLQQASITSQPTGEFSIAVPVMGDTRKLGTLILSYNRARVAQVGCMDTPPPLEQTAVPLPPPATREPLPPPAAREPALTPVDSGPSSDSMETNYASLALPLR